MLGTFFDCRLVDRLVAVIAPKVVGGRRAVSAVGGRGVARMAEAKAVGEMRRRSIGGDEVFEGYLTDVDEFFRNVEGATSSLKPARAEGR